MFVLVFPATFSPNNYHSKHNPLPRICTVLFMLFMLSVHYAYEILMKLEFSQQIFSILVN
jgi:hypothetical protein